MAQFDVHRNPDPASRDLYPYLLDLQTDMLARLATRVVAPLAVASQAGPAARVLNPTFEIEGTTVILSTPELAAIRRDALGEMVVSLQPHRDDIISALNLLFTGL
jgi:toxin CcdB